MLVNWSRWLNINLTERFHLDLKLLYIRKLKKLLLCFELYLHWNLLGKIRPFAIVWLAQRIRKTNENPEILTTCKFLIKFLNSLHLFFCKFSVIDFWKLVNLFIRNVENDQTYFKNLVVFTPQDFWSMFVTILHFAWKA